MKFVRMLPPAAAACLCLAAYGEEAPGDQAPAFEEIIVLGHPLSGEGLAQPADVLAGEELERKIAGNIGATISREPGIHNSSFGAAVGRPVIHGLAGPRVRIMEDRIDTMDVAVTSGDHAVTVEPSIADRVEILKGSSTLLYGSGAIGGIIDVHTGRVPHGLEKGLSGKLNLSASDNGDATSGAFRLDGAAGGFAWHLDGFSRKADDYEIPGFAESAALHALEEAEEEEQDDHDEEEEHHDEEEEEAVEGLMAGSALDLKGGAAGFSFVGERGFIGMSVSKLDSEYGIPGGAHDHGDHGHDEEDEHHEGEEDEDHEGDDHDEEEEEHGEEGDPIADLRQTRLDFEAALRDPLPGFSSLNLRLGLNDYQHDEIEASGEVGTSFENDAWEARAEMTHEEAAGWKGVFGAQLGNRTFSVVGEEAFTPPVDTDSFGLFWMGERSFSALELEAGLRFDRVRHDPDQGERQSFSGLSASLGAVLPLDESWTATLLADYSSRAPVGEELFSDGPHFATQSFEVGDPGLSEERALNLSATLRGEGERWRGTGTFYYTRFSDFIYQAATGEEMDELPVFLFAQTDATFLGMEAEAAVIVASGERWQFELNGQFDLVSAQLDLPGNDNMPRLPPSRLGMGAALQAGRLNASLSYLRAFKQNDLADFELPTDGYDDLRVYLGWDFPFEQTDAVASIYLQGRNLTDDEQRHHSSIVKDRVPAPGRTLEAGLRLRF